MQPNTEIRKLPPWDRPIEVQIAEQRVYDAYFKRRRLEWARQLKEETAAEGKQPIRCLPAGSRMFRARCDHV